jgi:endonuclease/exonuclease/phosphatase family metal-dependent hydrolase
MEYLRSMGYRDAYRARHKGSGSTYPAGDARSRIDYILVKGRVTIVSSGVLADDPSLSDHVGVFAEIT